MGDLPAPVIMPCERFHVLRDDLLPGGTKRRVLHHLLRSVTEDELVYPGHAGGFAGLALALAAQDHGKRVRLFFPFPLLETDVLRKTIALPNVSYEVIEGAVEQQDVVPAAQAHAEAHRACMYPIGFNMPSFSAGLVSLAKSLPISPQEVWVLGGSGTLARALDIAWPGAVVQTVNLGMPHGSFGDTNVWHAPELPDEQARFPPPYPSAPLYDAKIWRFASVHGIDGALIWNVAG